MPQHLGSRGLRIERITAIDQREKKAVPISASQKNLNEERAARAEIRTAQFRDSAFRQPAADRLIDRLQSRRPALIARRAGLRKTLGQELAQIDDLFARCCHDRDWHKSRICSTEQLSAFRPTKKSRLSLALPY